jgi:hypothetical protein
LNAVPASADAVGHPVTLTLVARFKRLRVLAWQADILYAARGYDLFRGKISTTDTPSDDLPWLPVATCHPARWRRATATTNLTARLCRDGFHALTVLPSGGFVAAVPGAIVTLRPHETEFRTTHPITRGTRPLHITAVPDGTVFWGEYFDNSARDEVHIYASEDRGSTWQVAYTFPKGAIRHVHNVVYDAWGDCLWVLTGDSGNECRIMRASCDFSRVDTIRQGNQQARAVAIVPTEEGVYFSTDTPREGNCIYHLDRAGELSRFASISSSSIYGCRVGRDIFFSTMVEPSQVNTDRRVRIYRGRDGQSWRPVLAWEKDRWPVRLFQYGNAFLPDGNNGTLFLALTTVAVKSDDCVTSLYSVGP